MRNRNGRAAAAAETGKVFYQRQRHDKEAVIPVAREFVKLGFESFHQRNRKSADKSEN